MLNFIHVNASDLTRVEVLMHTLARGDSTDGLGKIASEHIGNGGKRIRAQLALTAAKAVDAEIDAAPWATACELLHNASLIHDDIQDGDQFRRQKKSIWAEYGFAQAINAGDLLLMLPLTAVDRLTCPDHMKWNLTRALIRRAQAAARGQALELSIRQNINSTWAEWSHAYQGKTGELLALPLEGAALLGGLPTEAAKILGNIFRKFGIVYQIWNDIGQTLSLTKQTTPKDLSSLGILLITHLQLQPEDSSLAALTLASKEGCPRAASELLDRIHRGSGIHELLERGEDILETIRRDPALAAYPGLQELAEDLATLSPLHGQIPMQSAIASYS